MAQLKLQLTTILTKGILFTSWSNYVFVSRSLPVSILETEQGDSELKRWTKKLKCCERNKQCEK